jgi:hypothetical protein
MQCASGGRRVIVNAYCLRYYLMLFVCLIFSMAVVKSLLFLHAVVVLLCLLDYLVGSVADPSDFLQIRILGSVS